MRVVVTRAAHQAEELAAPLRERGFEVVLLPVIEISPPAHPSALQQAVNNLDRYDWIIFTSVNAVKALHAVLPGTIPRARIATVGVPTRKAAEKAGFEVSVTPGDYIAEALIEALGHENLTGKRILIPSAAITRDVIPPALRRCGAHVDAVEAYRTTKPSEAAANAALVFLKPYPDWVLFASSSAVENLAELVGVEVLRKVKIASIGPATSATLRKLSLEPHSEAREYSMRGLIDAVS